MASPPNPPRYGNTPIRATTTRTRTTAPPGSTGPRLAQPTLDHPAHRRTDSPPLRRDAASRPCRPLPATAPALVAAEATPAGARAQRGGHRALEARHLSRHPDGRRGPRCPCGFSRRKRLHADADGASHLGAFRGDAVAVMLGSPRPAVGDQLHYGQPAA